MIWGIFLITIGILFFIGNVSEMGMETLWPVFPLGVGLALYIGFLMDRSSYGLLMPGTILVVISLLFFYCNFSGWWRMETLWPVFILAPAGGFLAMYFGGTRDQGLLVPAAILTSIGIVLLFIRVGLGDYWPVFLVIAGILLIAIPAFGVKKKADGESEDGGDAVS